MGFINLDTIIRNRYKRNSSHIRVKNMELEQIYFSNPKSRIPISEIMQGKSYEEHFISFKAAVKRNNAYEISQIFSLLQEYFLFSAGHDMMFKTKLKADLFVTKPMDDFLYPILSQAIHDRYNDISIMQENPNFEANMKGIERIEYVYNELQSLLYFLYCYDFQFPDGWTNLFSDAYPEIIKILEESRITIGEFRTAFIDYKCQIMRDIMKEIPDFKLRMSYFKKIADLKKEKQQEESKFADVDLPITYFLTHTISDFINMPPKSPIILGNEAPKKATKILLPNNLTH